VRNIWYVHFENDNHMIVLLCFNGLAWDLIVYRGNILLMNSTHVAFLHMLRTHSMLLEINRRRFAREFLLDVLESQKRSPV
jgi:hypothetical protein